MNEIEELVAAHTAAYEEHIAADRAFDATLNACGGAMCPDLEAAIAARDVSRNRMFSAARYLDSAIDYDNSIKNKKDKMKELRVAAYDAELALSKSTAATWHAASEYCDCAGNVYNASDKDADENSNEVTRHTREVDWDSYLKAMDVLSAAKNIAQKTKVIPTIEYKEDK